MVCSFFLIKCEIAIFQICFILEVCKVGDDCGFIKWHEDAKISIVERNKILERRIEEFVSEIERFENELRSLNSNKQGNNTRDEDNSINTWNVREEISIPKLKIGKEKQQRATTRFELKTVK